MGDELAACSLPLFSEQCHLMLCVRSEDTRVVSRDGTSARGFTLIELLVVIIIIAILAAVAIPVFLQQRKRAYESAAIQQLTIVAKTQESYFTENGHYTSDLTEGSETGLWSQGWRADAGVVVGVTATNSSYPGGICIQSYSTSLPRSVYHFTNVGPGAGNIKETLPAGVAFPACA